MNELPIFISFREEDGAQLARWLHQELHGQSLTLRGPFLHTPAVVSTFFAPAGPAVSDWRELHDKELNRARALVVVCTPGAMIEFDGEDWFYREIRWWLNNRSTIAPILVSPSQQGIRWIPSLIKERWPGAHIVKIDLFTSSTSMQSSIDSILGGIASIAHGYISIEPVPWREVGMPNPIGVYSWEKDKEGHYINANENYARAAGFDSVKAMIGKTDYDMPWRSLADFFRAGDYGIVSGSGHERVAVQEKEIMVDRVADILVYEGQLLDRFSKCVGVTGCFSDITGKRLVPSPSREEHNEFGFYLGKEFGNECLTDIEVEVFKKMVQSHSEEMMAIELKLSHDQVVSHIRSIRRKFGCSTNGDIIATAVRSGLPLTLFGPVVEGG